MFIACYFCSKLKFLKIIKLFFYENDKLLISYDTRDNRINNIAHKTTNKLPALQQHTVLKSSRNCTNI